MANYRDMAKAEHVTVEEAEAAAEQATRDAFVAAGLAALEPLFRKANGELLVPNWSEFLEVLHFDMEGDNVLVRLTDGSGVFFGVHPREGTVQLYKKKETPEMGKVDWLAGPHVTSLHEVGKHLESGEF